MPDPPDNRAREEEVLVPGVLSVTPTPSGRSDVRIGAAAGWMVPRGIVHWERELSFIARSQMTADLARALRATQPYEQIAPKRFPFASRATEQSPILGICANLVADVRQHGVRVHTVGVDRVSSGFYYFAEGGTRDPVRVQGSLVEMLSPSLTGSSTNAEISSLLEDLIDRLLSSLSEGDVSELSVELADALPRLSRDGTGLAGTDIDAFDGTASVHAERSQRWTSTAGELAEILAAATRRGQTLVTVPLYGESRREVRPALEIQIDGKLLTLPEHAHWTVSGRPREEVKRAEVKRAEVARTQAAGALVAPTGKAAPSPIAAPQSPAPPKATAEPAPSSEPTAAAIVSTPVVVLSQRSEPVAATTLPAKPAPVLATGQPQPEGAPIVAAEQPSEGLPPREAEPEAFAGSPRPVAEEAIAVESGKRPVASVPQAGASQRPVAKSDRPRATAKASTAKTIALLLAALATVVACLVLNRLWTLYH